MGTQIEGDDLHASLKPPVIVTTYLKGDDTVEHILIEGGKHPRMEFVDDAAHCRSFSATVVFTTTDPTISLLKGASRLVVAVTAGGSAASGFKERFTHTAAAAAVSEEIGIFEREDDVVVQITGAGNAATFNALQLYFNVLE